MNQQIDRGAARTTRNAPRDGDNQRSRGHVSYQGFGASGQALAGLAIGLSTALLGLGTTAATLANPSFDGVGEVSGGFTSSTIFGVSGDGQVAVGQSFGSNGVEAIRWENGVLTTLPELPGGDFLAIAQDANFDGTIIIGTSKGSVGFNEVVTWSGGNVIGWGDLAGGRYASNGYGLSAAGDILAGGGESFSGTEALRVVNGVMSGLGDIPGGGFFSRANGVSGDGSIIVGIGRGTSPEYEAVRWVNGSLQRLGKLAGGESYSNAEAVSADGTVIVGWSGSTAAGIGFDAFEAFRWENNVMQGLGDLPGGPYRSEAYGVSGDGSVIVGLSETANGDEAFIWDAQNGMRNLAHVLTNDFNLNLSGWTLTQATDISDDGLTIVGVGINPNGDQEGWVARIDDSSGGGGGDPIDCGNVLDPGLPSGSNTFIRNQVLAQTFRPTSDGLLTEIIHGLDTRGGLTAFNAYITTTDRSGFPPTDYERNNLWSGLNLTNFSSGSTSIDGRIQIPGNETFDVISGVAYALILEPASSGSMSWRGSGTTGGAYADGTALEFDTASRSWQVPTLGPLDHTFQMLGCIGPVARYTGPCPGTISIEVSGAEPNSTVAVLYAQTLGGSVVPFNRPCSGTILEISGIGLRVAGTVQTDGNGEAVFTGIAPSAACSGWVQLLDLSTCDTSNVVQLN